METKERYYVKLIHCGNKSIVNPGDREQKNVFFMPMGLFPMADVLQKADFDIEIIHLDLEGGKTLEQVLDFQRLDAVGFDCHWVNQSLVVMETAAAVKQVKPEVFVFLGGFSASLFAQEIVGEFPEIDAVVRGDGERPLLELCRVLRQHKQDGTDLALETVSNLAWRDKGAVRMNEVSYVGTADDMEDLDFAAVELLRGWETYRTACTFFTHCDPLGSVPVFFLEVGRGCGYACLFCGGNCEAQKQMNRRTQTAMRSVESVIRTIKKAVSYGYETFYTCMEYEGSDQWYIELCRRIIEEQIRINFCYGSWRLPSQQLIDALAEACQEVLFEISPENADDDLRAKNKDRRIYYTNDQLEQCLDYINKKEKRIIVQLYFGYYLVGDTEETIFETIHFILTLVLKYSRILEGEYSNFSTDPGSLLFLFPEKYGFEIKVRNFKDYLNHLKMTYQEQKEQSADMILFRPRVISESRDREIRKRIRLLNVLFNSFRKSVSHILKKVGDPGVLVQELKESGIDTDQDNRFAPAAVKGFLITLCEKGQILDEYLFQLISYEHQQMVEAYKPPLPVPQMYLDFEVDREKLTDTSYASMKGFLTDGSESVADESDLDIEFNI